MCSTRCESNPNESRILQPVSRIPQQRFAILEVLPPYAIGSVAMFWVIQRIAAF